MKKIILVFLLSINIFILTGCIVFVKSETEATIIESLIPTEVSAEDFDISTIRLQVTLDNGDKTMVNLTEDMIVSPSLEELKTPGTHTVRIVYKDSYIDFEITLLANYPDVTITFYDENEAYTVKTTTKYSSITELPTITKEGYRFDGWYHESYYATMVTLDDTYNSDSSVYAKFTPFGNKVTFDFNYGDIDNYVEIISTGDKPINFLEPTRDGYVFKGWYSSSTATVTDIPYDFNKVIYGDVIVYARWEAK